MVQFNLALREINCKVVYFGPGLSGKTTNLEVVHRKAPEEAKGTLSSIATESDRTLFFDFMPLNLGTVAGMKVKFQLYTVPGQVYYNSTRKLVLRGADGVIFVADSNPTKMEENLESLRNLEECLREQGRSLSEIPHVIQFNKRDVPGAMTSDEMRAALATDGAPCFEACANVGTGVVETFKGLSMLVLQKVKAMSEERLKSGTKTPTPENSGARTKPPETPLPGTRSEPLAAPRPLAIQRNAIPMPETAAPAVAHKPTTTSVPIPIVPARAPAAAATAVPPAPAPTVATTTPPRPAPPPETRRAPPAVEPRATAQEPKRAPSPVPPQPVAVVRHTEARVISSGRKSRSMHPAVVWLAAAVVGAATAVGVMLALK